MSEVNNMNQSIRTLIFLVLFIGVQIDVIASMDEWLKVPESSKISQVAK